MKASAGSQELKFSVLDEALIRYRRLGDGVTVHATLPELLLVLANNDLHDFPALRPHQRHPWHAFLVQLAAVAMHIAGREAPFESTNDWRQALLALTPQDPDGAAWCLISPPDRPALLQAPVVGSLVADWKTSCWAADELDMLVTSKNHDVKGARATRALPDDWLFSMLSLQTQEGFLGAGNYGISRMNGGFASRSGVGVADASRHWGRRWLRDISVLLRNRTILAQERGLAMNNGIALVWLMPWDGVSSLSFSALDPFYIEVCRWLRLGHGDRGIFAVTKGTKAARIAAKDLNGLTGDAWSPVATDEAKALTINAEGFHYKLMAELLFGEKYTAPIAQSMELPSGNGGHVLVAQGMTRGQGKTEGYHERRIPISVKMRSLLLRKRTDDRLARVSTQRIDNIHELRKILWSSLALLFSNGVPGKEKIDSVKNKANTFSRPFEKREDARFFSDLSDEIESDDPDYQRLKWQLALVDRAEAVLLSAFDAGPRSGVQRYRAQSAALSRFHGSLRGQRSPLIEFSQFHREKSASRQEQEEKNDHI